jgi:hypothetical protein
MTYDYPTNWNKVGREARQKNGERRAIRTCTHKGNKIIAGRFVKCAACKATLARV